MIMCCWTWDTLIPRWIASFGSFLVDIGIVNHNIKKIEKYNVECYFRFPFSIVLSPMPVSK